MDNKKKNGKVSSVLAMVLATTVVIGLLTSTAGKLAVATYLMKTSKKQITQVPFVGEIIGDIIEDAPTTQAPTTQAPTTQAPTTQAPTTEAPTTEAPTTEAPATDAPTQAPTQAPVTEATEPAEKEQTLKEKQAILKSYTDVVSKAKSSKFSCTKTTTRTSKTDFLTSIFSFLWGDLEGSNTNYFKTEVVKIKDGDGLCINNDGSACLINPLDGKVVAAAIDSGLREELDNGNVRITLNFKDEANPKPIKSTDKKSASFTAAAFPVVTAEEFRVMLDNAQRDSKTETVDITYTGCKIVVEYNPKTGEISYLEQTAVYVAAVEDGRKKADFTVTDASVYTEFKY